MCDSNAVVDKTLRYTLLCVCHVEAWYASVSLVMLPGAYARNSAGKEELPDDDTHVSKHVGAEE
jgi:hypothetical protein